MNNIYMGYDSREILAYDVARYSIISRASTETRIIPLELNDRKNAENSNSSC